MAATWPASLQQKLNVDSFDLKIGDTTVRSDMDVGPAKVRRRMTKSTDILTCSIWIDFDDYNELYQFFDVDCNGGATPFEFVHPFTGVTQLFRFTQTPDIKPLGGREFVVSMSWEILP